MFRSDTVPHYVDRFRALIIGRANAGKTTILKAICGSDQDPMVRRVQPSAERGEHDIYHELVFTSNRGFVFHDSRGFESGRDDEIEAMKQFLTEKSNSRTLKERLHAIWYCIPVDNDRLITAAELQFFNECNPQGVPVILLFTKFESRDARAFSELIEGRCSRSKAAKLAPARAEKKFQEEELQRFTHTYPPKGILFIRGTKAEGHQFSISNEQCSRIIEMTTENLTDSILKHLLISVQKLNVMLSVKYATESAYAGTYSISSTRESIKQLLYTQGPYDPHNENYIKLWHSVGCWFSHVVKANPQSTNYGQPPLDRPRSIYYYRSYYKSSPTRMINRLSFERIRLPQLPMDAISNQPLFVVFTCACMLIVLEHSSWLQDSDRETNLRLAGLHLIKTGSSDDIWKDISTSFTSEFEDIHRILSNRDVYISTVAPKLFDIVKRYLIPRDYQPKLRLVDRLCLIAPTLIVHNLTVQE